MGGARPPHDECDLRTAINTDERNQMNSRNTLCTKISLENSTGNQSCQRHGLVSPASFGLPGPSYLRATTQDQLERHFSLQTEVRALKGSTQGEQWEAKHGLFFHLPGLLFEMRSKCWENMLVVPGSETNERLGEPRGGLDDSLSGASGAPVRREGPPNEQ